MRYDRAPIPPIITTVVMFPTPPLSKQATCHIPYTSVHYYDPDNRNNLQAAEN